MLKCSLALLIYKKIPLIAKQNYLLLFSRPWQPCRGGITRGRAFEDPTLSVPMVGLISISSWETYRLVEHL
jgi:hypothetical protein